MGNMVRMISQDGGAFCMAVDSTDIAAKAGIDAANYYGRAAMGIAWGDQWTNMIQPFWALPALGVAGLKAKDIMGYLVVILIFTGIVACGGFLLWGMMF